MNEFCRSHKWEAVLSGVVRLTIGHLAMTKYRIERRSSSVSLLERLSGKR